MSKSDEVLGTRRLAKFSKAVSRILYHIEPSQNGLNSRIQDTGHEAKITILLISAATELETAWNVLRLPNIPAVRRQGRVACEFISVVVLSCIPRDVLAALPKKQAPISKALNEFPNLYFFDLYDHLLEDPNASLGFRHILATSKFYESFLYVAEHILDIPAQTIQSIRDYRQYVQHPASHGTFSVTGHHFRGFSPHNLRAGSFLSQNQYFDIRSEGNQLIALAELLADILDWTTYRYLDKNGNA
jgi:hypothetical protein